MTFEDQRTLCRVGPAFLNCIAYSLTSDRRNLPSSGPCCFDDLSCFTIPVPISAAYIQPGYLLAVRTRVVSMERFLRSILLAHKHVYLNGLVQSGTFDNESSRCIPTQRQPKTRAALLLTDRVHSSIPRQPLPPSLPVLALVWAGSIFTRRGL